MKNGFSMIMSLGIVLVILILSTVSVMSYNKSKELIEFKRFASELFMIQDKVDDYIFRNNKYPIKDKVYLNYADVEIISKSQFKDCERNNNVMTFYKLDFDELDITLNNRGFSDNTTNLYAYSLDNNKVYYLKGFDYEDFYHYTLNNEMYKLTGISKIE